jgi:hypothetical protein
LRPFWGPRRRRKQVWTFLCCSVLRQVWFLGFSYSSIAFMIAFLAACNSFSPLELMVAARRGRLWVVGRMKVRHPEPNNPAARPRWTVGKKSMRTRWTKIQLIPPSFVSCTRGKNQKPAPGSSRSKFGEHFGLLFSNPHVGPFFFFCSYRTSFSGFFLYLICYDFRKIIGRIKIFDKCISDIVAHCVRRLPPHPTALSPCRRGERRQESISCASAASVTPGTYRRGARR